MVKTVSEFIAEHQAPAIIAGIIFLLWFALWMKRSSMSYSPVKWVRTVGLTMHHLIFIGLILAVLMACFINWHSISDGSAGVLMRGFFFAFLLLLNVIGCGVALMLKRTLSLDNRHKKDAYSFWAQNAIVLFIGVTMIEAVLIFRIDSENFLAFGIVASLLGWIFQDIIKGMLSYYHMRSIGLLHIGDWIQIDGKGVDGVITDISLVNVTVSNFDNTISSIPTASLQAEHLRNNQRMLDGKTSGRRMMRTFLIDCNSIRSLSPEQIAAIKDILAIYGEDTVTLEDVKAPVLNVQLYRLYLRHWLLNHDQVVRAPRLMVRLLEHTPEGYPLQVYAFLLPTGLMPFELEQSRIIEHVLLSMEWFGLKLYQHPTQWPVASVECERPNE